MDIRTGLPIVGMVGGGQLARMTHQAAIALGQSLRVLAASDTDAAAQAIPHPTIADHADLAALRSFAKDCDVITFDHEHVPSAHIRALAADGVVVRPHAQALRHAQNKRAMREAMSRLGVASPAWAPIGSVSDVATFAAKHGWPVVLKAVTGGYDGRGVWLAHDEAEVAPLVRTSTDLLVEAHVAIRAELAAVVARSVWGQVAAYPVVETLQRDGICVEVLAPAPELDPETAVTATELAIRIAQQLDVMGILAVELFLTSTGALLVNELAMRPHNSAHWTIEGSLTSQFEQHLRAVLDYPLGQTTMAAPAAATANVLGGAGGGMALDERVHHLFAADPGVRLHLYGKQPRPGRKLGHVTVIGDNIAAVRARAVRAAQWLRDGPDDG